MSQFFDFSLEILTLSVKELLEAGYEIKRSLTFAKEGLFKENEAELIIPLKSPFVDYLNANYRSILVTDEMDEYHQLVANRHVSRNEEDTYVRADFILDDTRINCRYHEGEGSDIQKGYFDNDQITISVSGLLAKTDEVEEPLNPENPLTNHSDAWLIYEFLLSQANIGFSVEVPKYAIVPNKLPFTALIQKRQSDMQAIEHVISTLPTEGE